MKRTAPHNRIYLTKKSPPFRRGSFFGGALALCLALTLLPAGAATRRSQALLYVTRTPTPAELARRQTHAKYEPAAGCYLGAFIDFDGSLKRPIRDQNRTDHQDPAGFEAITGKPHAMYFFYLGYGRPLPLDWVRTLAARGKFVHIALEPNDGLARVKDDAYLRKLADDMARSQAHIFLRFASEMNGRWTNYHRSPEDYRRKFRLVHDVMRRRAPNVAMVWCPYTMPAYCIADYYPGDDATDWVGINMYSVTYHDNRLSAPCEYEHPCDLLSYVYNRYSARKPIMICEFAATHYAGCEGRSRPDFAMRKILTLYEALPRLFPRVKCVNYFDGNTIQYAGERASNDYSVTDDRLVIATYRYAIAAPYFLPAPLPEGARLSPPPMPMPVRQGEPLRGMVQLSCFARSPSDFVTVRYKVDGYRIYTAARPDLWECLWDAGSVRPGKHTLSLEALRRDGRVAASQTVIVVTSR